MLQLRNGCFILSAILLLSLKLFAFCRVVLLQREHRVDVLLDLIWCNRFASDLFGFFCRSLALFIYFFFNLTLCLFWLSISASIYLLRWAKAVIDKLSSPFFWCPFQNQPPHDSRNIFLSPSSFSSSCFVTNSSGIWQDALAITVHGRCDFCIVNAYFLSLWSRSESLLRSVCQTILFRCCRFLDTSFKTARKCCHLQDYNWHCILP